MKHECVHYKTFVRFSREAEKSTFWRKKLKKTSCIHRISYQTRQLIPINAEILDRLKPARFITVESILRVTKRVGGMCQKKIIITIMKLIGRT